MAKGRFGGEDYKPKHLGAEPATSVAEAKPPVAPAEAPKAPAESSGTLDAATLEAMRSIKVPFASRISLGADRQLKELAKDLSKGKKHTQTDLLAEALNLLFKKHGKPPAA